MQVMKDIDIREPLIKKLIAQNAGHEYRIIPELAVCDGMSRVDVAVANGNLYGYEIKSDADTLDRLESQIMYYNKTFDKVFIVVGSKFEDVIADHVPDWWGIYTARYDKQNNVILKEKKRGRKNREVCAASLLELLWRDEIEKLLRNHGFKALSGKNRRILRKIAEENIPLSVIRDYTRETLKARKEWRQ
ncbi:MAG: sce7726 family protein [Lachnospiraceae bacterium]|nr:sce7726 family protein [Lachnospiraceae bacterium]